MKKIVAQVEHLELSYGKVKAVTDVSFDLYEGEILAIVGANGSGKTSTIECLEGLRQPNGGNVKMLGRVPHTNKLSLYKEVGIQLQDSEYPEHIKVKELCKLFASFYETPVDWRLLLKQFGFEEKSDRYVSKLSGGEKQRLSVLLALLPNPKVLILDELTTGLDPEVKRGMWDSLKSIQKAGTSILLVSHYMDEVEFLANRLVYIEHGRSLFVGSKSGFKSFAAQKVASNYKADELSLEEAYLIISPKTELLRLEEIL